MLSSTPAARPAVIPYGKQCVDEDDVEAVARVLRSDWLTTGPMVAEFERDFAKFTGTEHAVAVCNGTAALHAAMAALKVGPGDEVIVPAITFVASANCVVYQGGKPVFADVDPGTLLIDPRDVERKITPATKAIIAVDYAGQACDYDELRMLAKRHGLALVADACHALGGAYLGQPIGSLADLSTFSLHPVKPITAGEGGVITTNDAGMANAMRIFRNHGIRTDFRQREKVGSWAYEMDSLGYNYRLTDIQCALAASQLRKLPKWIARRQEIAAQYDAAFKDAEGVEPLKVRADVSHGYHLYVIKIRGDRDVAFKEFRNRGIGVSVHYAPVYGHPFYREKFGDQQGCCPVAEAAFAKLLSLPIYPGMTNEDVERVIAEVKAVASSN